MFFTTWQDFWNMGGYGFYVWLAYGISFILIVALLLQSILEKKAIMKTILREQQRQHRLQQAKQRGSL